MTELSHQAQAVLDAYMNNCGWLDGPLDRDYRCVAAVLRAAADQVVPLRNAPKIPFDAKRPTVEWHVWDAKQRARADLLAIATELENHQ